MKALNTTTIIIMIQMIMEKLQGKNQDVILQSLIILEIIIKIINI